MLGRMFSVRDYRSPVEVIIKFIIETTTCKQSRALIMKMFPPKVVSPPKNKLRPDSEVFGALEEPWSSACHQVSGQ